MTILDFYIDEQYIDRVLELLKTVKHEGYYAKMAVAWAYSFCFIKFLKKQKTNLKVLTRIISTNLYIINLYKNQLNHIDLQENKKIY